MDAALTTPKPANITTADAATVGVGFYTACLGVLPGLNIPIPTDPKDVPAGSGEFALVLGGSSSVGKFAVQLLHVFGYKVITTCSPKYSTLLKSIGAYETLDYKLAQDELISALSDITANKLYRVFDAMAANHDFVKALFQSVEGTKYFSSTDDWTPLDSKDFNDAVLYRVALGPIGRADATELNGMISQFIPLMYHLLQTGQVKPSEYEVIGEKGFESVAEAWAYQQSGKGGAKKVLAHLQDA